MNRPRSGRPSILVRPLRRAALGVAVLAAALTVSAGGTQDAVANGDTRSLTLVTCYPFLYVGHAPQRFVVRATQIEAVTAALPDEARTPRARP